MQRNLRRGLLALATLVLITGTVLAAEQGNFDRTLNVTGAVDLTVSTGSGHINIKTGATNTVAVHATVRVGDNFTSSQDARARLERILQNPPIEQNGNIIRIGRIDDPELNRNVSISYDLTVPAETRVSSKTGSGEQSVDGVRGPVEVTSGSGELRVSNVGAEVRVNTGSGDIRVSNVKGEVRASTGSGHITANGIGGAFDGRTGSGGIDLDQTAAGNVSAGTGSGDINLHNVKGALKVSTGSGDVHAQGEMTGDWRVETGSGHVQMDLPQQAGFELYARSSSGRITVDHELTMQGTLNRHEIRGKVKGGGYMVDLRTGSGDIVVR